MKNFPSGFFAWGLYSGIGKFKSKPDLALFFSKHPCQAVGVFTLNQVKAPPVLVSQKLLKNHSAQAILINSGCANACTGDQGMKDVLLTMSATAKGLEVPTQQVLPASTGVIGEYLPVKKMIAGISQICRLVKLGKSDPLKAVRAMMTTDTVPKFEGVSIKAQGKTYHLWGCVKGAGMIHPNMATMISVILTDVRLPGSFMKPSIQKAVDLSFNSATVDGDTSTNDSVYLLANGMSGVSLKSSQDLKNFETALNTLSLSLARKMISDGEGATKRIEIMVRGAKTPRDAKQVAQTIATSSLVKTAVFGNDANWGRILAAAGRSGVKINPDKIGIWFDRLAVVRGGMALKYSEAKASKILQKKIVPIHVDLGEGKAHALVLSSDFSYDYVKINAEYRT